jgi:Tol biopolymer transport system component
MIIISLGCTALSSCKQEIEVSETKIKNNIQEKPFLIHTVYFWFKDEVSEDRIQLFANDLERLSKVSSIQSFYYGPPASTEARAVVDNTYDIALNVHFASIEDEAKYQVDPIHLKFVEECKDLWDKVVVYDNLVQK